MDVEINQVNVKTLKPNYSWDIGNPHIGLMEEASINEYEIVGYAPFVHVGLSAVSYDQNPYMLLTTREIDFGDSYNPETSTELLPISGVSYSTHNYVMPGEYKITVTQTQYIKTNNPCCEPPCEGNLFVQQDLYIEKEISRERYPYSWMWYCFMQNDTDPRMKYFGGLEPAGECLTWDDCTFQGPRQLTWDEAQGPSFEIRSKDVSWQWKNVVSNPSSLDIYAQDIQWTFTKREGIIPKTWKEIKTLGCEGGNCIEVLPLLSANKVVTQYEKTIKVLEIPPQTYLAVVNTNTGEYLPDNDAFKSSPYTVRLSPKFTRCGSFPIEKIIWDLGDGSPIIERTRNNNSNDTMFIYNKEIERDIKDPRNYDLIHTYYRNNSTTGCFYPSITAIASSTSTADTAATVVGPIEIEQLNPSIDIIQNELTNDGKVYLGQVKDQLVFWTSK